MTAVSEALRGTWIIAAREVRSFFLSPFAYILLAVWIAWTSLSYMLLAEFYSAQTVAGGLDNPLSAFFGGTVLFFLPLLVFTPLLTMRLLAQERSQGTLEPLLTAPVSPFAVVMGKYFAGMVFWIALWLPTIVYAWITHQYGTVDWGAVRASYFGILMVGAYYIALGLFASAIAPNQMVAAVVGFCLLGLLFMMGIGENVFSGTLKDISAYVSIWKHMGQFARGIIDSRYVIFDISVTIFALSCTLAVMAWRREG